MAEKVKQVPVCLALVTAGGQGERMGQPAPGWQGLPGKLFIELNGRPALSYTLEALLSVPAITGALIVTPARLQPLLERLLKAATLCADPQAWQPEPLAGSGRYRPARTLLAPALAARVLGVTAGGPDRQTSVYYGLRWLRQYWRETAEPAGAAQRSGSGRPPVVMVHDAARCLLQPALVQACAARIIGGHNCVAAVTPKDSVAVLDQTGRQLARPLARGQLVQLQTPQCFGLDALLAWHEAARQQGYQVTDDSALALWQQAAVDVVQSSYENLKLTTPEDIDLALAILNRRQAAAGSTGLSSETGLPPATD
ncbi:MAG: 2-C-methyl-D-erythritol 4-phosphate cytidylyltransferase [Oscillospiraceae bacterium]|nr:2-C-methyl-D-erythritol 4-phosphate cytidylyltransferase [Oscillospiraceae bacterium]MDD4368461.1 2-C-methyl-D-erythritol 4-phosphate cytidylyltransferase [Oscillospiraceae bacterium]